MPIKSLWNKLLYKLGMRPATCPEDLIGKAHPITKTELLLELPRTEAIRLGLTIDLSKSPDSIIDRICKTYFGTCNVSVSRKAYQVLEESIHDSYGFLSMPIVFFGLCVAVKHWEEQAKNPKDFCLLYYLPTNRLGVFPFLFRYVFKIEPDMEPSIIIVNASER